MSHDPGRVHPSALISPEAELHDTVVVGAHVIIAGRVRIGPHCVLRPGAWLHGPLTMGRDNTVFPGAVLGEAPQHLKYNNEPTTLEIGDGNVFREHVTIHRGTSAGMTTRIGDHNLFMCNSHVGHDSIVGNHCILVNGALVGGHCVLEDRVYLSGNCAVHQFCRIGRLALLGGCSVTTKDIPPFVTQQHFDTVIGLNVIGMRRAGIGEEQLHALHRAFRVLFRAGLTVPAALAQLDRELGDVDVIQELLGFVRRSSRGINRMRGRPHRGLAS